MYSKYLAILLIFTLLLLSSPRKVEHINNNFNLVTTGFWDSEAKHLECTNYGNDKVNGRIIFQDQNGNDISFSPFNIEPHGLLINKLNIASKVSKYGTFKLEISNKTLNCFITSKDKLIPFDQRITKTSYASLNSLDNNNKNSNKTSHKVNIINFSSNSEFTLSFYAKDGNILGQETINLKKNERLIKNLSLTQIELVGITPSDKKTEYSANLITNNNSFRIAKNGNCETRNINLYHKKNNFNFTNLEDSSQKIFLSILGDNKQKLSNETVLIPSRTTYSLNLSNSSLNRGKIEVSCDKEKKILVNSDSKDSFMYGQSSKAKALIPIIKSSDVKNHISIYSQNSNVNISLLSTKGEKIQTIYDNLKIEGKLKIPIDTKYINSSSGLVLITASNIELEFSRDYENQNKITFPTLKLKATNVDNSFQAIEAQNLTLSKRCINRTSSALPQAEIEYDSLNFNLNKERLSKLGVENIDTFHILNLNKVKNILTKNDFFLKGIFNEEYLANKNYFYNNLCASLLYNSIDSRLSLDKYLQYKPDLSFDYKNSNKISLPGSAWLKSNPDKYLFCVKTLPDCKLSKEPTTEYAKAFISPNKIDVKPSKFYPLLTIDRPFIPKKNKKSFKIKSYIHNKVPYEIIATLSGVKQKEDNKINCKDLNSKYYLHFKNNKWVNSRKEWGGMNKFDLSLSYNSLTFVHSKTYYSAPKISDRCDKFYENCELGLWSVNIGDGYNSSNEPLAWGKFHQEDKYDYRWNSLPLLNTKKITFSKYIESNKTYEDCDLSEASVVLQTSRYFDTYPEKIAVKESKNKYALPRKIYHPNTYPLNQPAPGIPYAVQSKLNPYISKIDRMTLTSSKSLEGVKWLDTLPK